MATASQRSLSFAGIYKYRIKKYSLNKSGSRERSIDRSPARILRLSDIHDHLVNLTENFYLRIDFLIIFIFLIYYYIYCFFFQVVNLFVVERSETRHVIDVLNSLRQLLSRDRANYFIERSKPNGSRDCTISRPGTIESSRLILRV